MRYLAVATALTLLLGCRTSRPEPANPTHFASVSPSPFTLAPAVATDTVAANYSIEDLVFTALANSPQLAEAKHRIRALEHRIPQELALPDPTLNTTTHLLPVETAAGRQAFGLGVSQKYIRSEQRQTRAAIARDEAQAAKAELAKQERELAEKIRVVCIQLLEIRDTLRVTESDFDALKQIEEVTLRSYESAGDTSQQDVLNIQIEQSKVENELSGLRQREQSFQARLSRLAHLPTGTKFALTNRLTEVSSSQALEQLTAQALAARPELQSQLAKIQRDRRKIRLADLQNKPNYTFGLNWIATSSDGLSPVANGDDALMLGVGVNLPIYKDRICAAVGEATNNSLASSFALQSLQDQIGEEVFDSLAKLDSTRDMLSLLQEDIIPKSARTLELSIEDYSNGKSTYTKVITDWRSLLRYRLAEVRLLSERMQQVAILTRQVGQLEPLQPFTEASSNDSSLSVAERIEINESPSAADDVVAPRTPTPKP